MYYQGKHYEILRSVHRVHLFLSRVSQNKAIICMISGYRREVTESVDR